MKWFDLLTFYSFYVIFLHPQYHFVQKASLFKYIFSIFFLGAQGKEKLIFFIVSSCFDVHDLGGATSKFGGC
jgi:hypothetical protein